MESVTIEDVCKKDFEGFCDLWNYDKATDDFGFYANSLTQRCFDSFSAGWQASKSNYAVKFDASECETCKHLERLEAVLAHNEAITNLLRSAVRLMRSTGQYSGWQERADEAELLVNQELTSEKILRDLKVKYARDGFIAGRNYGLTPNHKSVMRSVIEESASVYANNFNKVE